MDAVAPLVKIISFEELALMNFACFGKELEFVMPYHGMDCVVSFEVLIESL